MYSFKTNNIFYRYITETTVLILQTTLIIISPKLIIEDWVTPFRKLPQSS